MTALPPLDQLPNKLLEKHAKNVYEFILTAENSAQNDNDAKNLMYSRVVGYLLLYPPTETAFSFIQNELSSICDNTETETERNVSIYALGRMYFYGFISPFKKSCTPIPPSSKNSSRTSLDSQHQSISQDSKNNTCPQDHKSAKQAALVREGYCCMVTGAFDFHSAETSPERFHEWMRTSGKSYISPTQCCHIIPQSVNNFESAKVMDKMTGTDSNSSTFWTIVQNFGYVDLRSQLKGAKIHDLSNIITLHRILHDKFDSLELWLEKVDNEKNTYKICFAPGIEAYLKYARVPVTDKVTFSVNYQESLGAQVPLPNPRYLQLHATCCRIAHLSGATEYLTQIHQGIEELPVLSQDGGSADVLSLALHCATC
ncbi:hypothetical protein ABKN59_005834 [Abortiporus biennis]